jgi:FkbM family methyltransferase
LVIAIEPDERNFRVLVKNCMHLSNISPHKAAVGLKNGSVYLKCDQNPVYSKVVGPDESESSSYKIDCVTLDSFIPLLKGRESQSVVVKIDVEGGEMEVLRGTSQFIRSVHPTLVMEVDDVSEVERTLKSIGYKSSQLFGSYWVFTPIQ